MTKFNKILLLIISLLILWLALYYRDNIYKYYTDITSSKSYTLDGNLEPSTAPQPNVTQVNGAVTRFQDTFDKIILWKNFTVTSNTVLKTSTHGLINQRAVIRVKKDSGILNYESDWFVVMNNQNVATEIRFKNIDLNYFVQTRQLEKTNSWIDSLNRDSGNIFLYQVSKMFSFLPSDLINTEKKLSDSVVYNNDVKVQQTGTFDSSNKMMVYTYYRDYLNSGLLSNVAISSKLSKYSDYILRKSGLMRDCTNLSTEYVLGCNEYYWFLDDKGVVINSLNLISKEEMFLNTYSNIDSTNLILIK
jgi:hypothetical protein